MLRIFPEQVTKASALFPEFVAGQFQTAQARALLLLFIFLLSYFFFFSIFLIVIQNFAILQKYIYICHPDVFDQYKHLLLEWYAGYRTFIKKITNFNQRACNLKLNAKTKNKKKVNEQKPGSRYCCDPNTLRRFFLIPWPVQDHPKSSTINPSWIKHTPQKKKSKNIFFGFFLREPCQATEPVTQKNNSLKMQLFKKKTEKWKMKKRAHLIWFNLVRDWFSSRASAMYSAP